MRPKQYKLLALTFAIQMLLYTVMVVIIIVLLPRSRRGWTRSSFNRKWGNGTSRAFHHVMNTEGSVAFLTNRAFFAPRPPALRAR
jgi:preprotein translocase subunit SecG